MQSVQPAQVGESHQSQLERIRHEVRSSKAMPITLQPIFNLRLQQSRLLDLLIFNHRVRIRQMSHSGTVGNGTYSTSCARKRGKPTVQPPAIGHFGNAPLPPSCESYAVSNSARDKTQNLEACEKRQWDGVCGAKKKTQNSSADVRARGAPTRRRTHRGRSAEPAEALIAPLNRLGSNRMT